ncbi:hypothetical protein C4577_02810 [Candidatus Parcubacteria bacterium]|nr:MAG: hypothetical protein C4577_02810 [Candidatus Parcubacteria bacterium]
MPKKTTILIVILALVTSVLVYLAISTENRRPLPKEQPQVTKINKELKPVKTARLYFQPENLNTSGVYAPITSDVFIDAGKNKVSGVQLEMAFDPEAITKVDIASPTDNPFFSSPNSVILFKDIDYNNGRISYAVAISPTEDPKTAIGKVATITFTPNSSYSTTEAEISFLNKTIVTELGTVESILDQATPLKLDFSSSNPTPTPQACIQVITFAKNPTTEECTGFRTPCDVPEGWTNCQP